MTVTFLVNKRISILYVDDDYDEAEKDINDALGEAYNDQ